MQTKTNFLHQVGARLQHKLMLLVLAVAAIAVVIPAAVGVYSGVIDEHADGEVEKHNRALVDSLEMEQALLRERAAADALIHGGGDAALQSFGEARRELDSRHQAVALQVEDDVRHGDEQAPDARDLLQACKAGHEEIGQIFYGAMVPLSRQDPSSPELQAQAAALSARADSLHADLAEIKNFFEKEMADERSAQEAAVATARAASWASMVLALALGLVLAWYFSRRLTARVLRLQRATAAMAAGELSTRVDVGGSDELSRLGSSFNRMAAELERSTRALEEEEARVRSIHQSLSDGIIVLDEEGVIQSVNPAAAVFLGRTAGELEGTDDTGVPELQEALARPTRPQEEMVKCWEEKQCTHPECPAYGSDDRRCWLQCGTYCHNQLQGTFRQKRDACESCEVFRKNAERRLELEVGRRILQAVVRPILDNEGRRAGKNVVLVDVTGLRRANDKLLAEHARLEALYQATMAACRLDPKEAPAGALAELAGVDVVDMACVCLFGEGAEVKGATCSLGLPQDAEKEMSALACSDEITGLVESGETEIVTDLGTAGEKYQALARFGARTLALLPLAARSGEPLGVFMVGSRRAAAFDHDDMEMLKAAAAGMASAIENAELYQHAQREMERERAKQRIAEVLASGTSLEEVFDELGVELARLVDFDRASIAVPGGDGYLRVLEVYGRTVPEMSAGRRIPAKGTAVEWVMKHREPKLVEDIAGDEGFDLQEQLASMGLRSHLHLPLLVEDRVVGTLNLASRRAGAFSEKDVITLAPVASLVAMTLEKQALFESIRDAKVEWEETSTAPVKASWWWTRTT